MRLSRFVQTTYIEYKSKLKSLSNLPDFRDPQLDFVGTNHIANHVIGVEGIPRKPQARKKQH